METRRLLAVAFVALLVATAGCSGLGGDADRAAPSEDGPSGDGGDAAAAEPAREEDADEAATEPPAADRQLIRTGELELRVDDGAAAGDRVREVALEYGGFVAARESRTHERYNESWRTERVVLRVPSEDFDAAFAELAAVGEVERSSIATEDVTDRLVDLEARLENLRAERDRLRELYDDANGTQDVLAVQRELADVQEEIERLEAQRARLEDQVAFATITVHLAEPEPEPEATPTPTPEPAWYDTGATTAFVDSASALGTTLRALFVLGAYLAPWAVVFGTPVVGLVAVYRYREA